MSEQRTRHVHRLCPCDSYDVEGIQSWLEDLAEEGLFLIKDGVFGGVFSFERRTPQKVSYRLDVAQKRKTGVMDDARNHFGEEVELYRAMGWEYLLSYGEFHIYRATKADAPELNTDTETHAFTISLLKKKQRSAVVRTLLYVLFLILWTQGFLRYGFRMAVSFGLIFTASVYGSVLLAVLEAVLRVIRLRRYEKRLLEGDSLTHRVDWKKTAFASFCKRALPIVLACGFGYGLISALITDGTEYLHKDYPGEPPFATVADIFPEGTLSEESVWLDYGIYKTGETVFSKNVEWNESCDVTAADGTSYFCILRLSYYETASEWIARGLEENYFEFDAKRHYGKRFEVLDAPDLDVDSIRVYNNYGTLCVLMREGNRVVYAVVTIDGPDDQNHWELWAHTMADFLK